MKLMLPCMACFQELGSPTNELTTLEFRDDGRYVIRCSRGHESVTVLQQQKFEILFDIGANAIIDGYYREAISSFTSSLERFYEFCIKVFCEKKELNDAVYAKTWKQVSNQSERQLGAFLFLWASELGETPELLTSNNTKFRNEVIHKGRIPSKVEALEYGNTILTIMKPKIEQLKSLYPEEISRVTFKHIRACSEIKEGQVSGGTMCAATIISLTTDDETHNNQTLEDAMSSILKWRDAVSRIDGTIDC